MFLEALGIFVPSGSNHANVEGNLFFLIRRAIKRRIGRETKTLPIFWIKIIIVYLQLKGTQRAKIDMRMKFLFFLLSDT